MIRGSRGRKARFWSWTGIHSELEAEQGHALKGMKTGRKERTRTTIRKKKENRVKLNTETPKNKPKRWISLEKNKTAQQNAAVEKQT